MYGLQNAIILYAKTLWFLFVVFKPLKHFVRSVAVNYRLMNFYGWLNVGYIVEKPEMKENGGWFLMSKFCCNIDLLNESKPLFVSLTWLLQWNICCKQTKIITNQYINTIYIWKEDLKHVTSDRKTSIYDKRIVCRRCNSTPGTEEHFAVNRYLWPPTFVNSVTRALPRVIWNLSKIFEKTRPITLIHFVKKMVHLIVILTNFFR